MEKARCNTELYSNLRAPLNNVKPSNFWGSHQFPRNTPSFLYGCDLFFVDVSVILEIPEEGCNDGSYYGHAGHQQEEGVPAEMVRVPA